MNARRLAFPAFIAGSVLLLIVAFAVLQIASPARALPPAGTDTVSISADVSIAGRAGSETVHLTGTATIQRQDPHLDAGVEVVNASITAINLTGQSLAGPITVSQSATLSSTGEIRSLQPSIEYPASSFFNVYVDALIPSSGSRTIPPFYVHNDMVIHLTNQASINSWPPYGVKFQMQVGTTPTPTPSPTPSPTTTPATVPGGPDCTNGVPLLPQDPNSLCVRELSITMSLPPTPTPTQTPCVPTCTPTPTVTGTSTRTATRTPTVTRTPTPFPTVQGPENPVFSVAGGGPSGLPPAALLALAPPGAPTAVSGNNDFLNGWPIGSLPFTGTETTFGMTTQSGEPKTVAPSPVPEDYCILNDPNIIGATTWFRFTPSSSGTLAIETTGSSFDTVLAAYTGSALNALTQVACSDDTATLQSQISFSATAGTDYYVQAGGFVYIDGPATGQLRLHVTMSGAAGAAGQAAPRIAVSCGNLGLTAAGCASGDDLDALSLGTDFVAGSQPIFFTVAPGSLGAPGSGVAAQAACSPAEPQADEFASSRNGNNFLFLDGDGQGSSGCPTAFGLGLIERPTSADLDALTGEPASAIDTNSDGIPDNAVFFSLKTGSPSLTTLGRGPADILWTVGGFQPGLYASSSQLGLQSSDDIDGLCVADRGDPRVYESAVDTVYFSLAPGSPSLAAIGASPADVIGPGPQVVISAVDLGLQSGDNLQDMKCFSTSGGNTVTVPVGDIWYCDASQLGQVCDTIIHVGDTVLWDFSGAEAPHTTTECGGPNCASPVPKNQALWNSGIISPSSPVRTFQYTFNATGFYYYYCQVHTTGHLGRIIVVGGGATPTPTRTRTPTATPPPSVRTGDANKDGSVDAIDAALILQFSAALLASINPHADANHSGRIDAIDAALVLQVSAGLLTNLP